MDDLEAAVHAAKAADHSAEVQAAESRVRSLQGSLSRKEDAIRELRERMDQACRCAITIHLYTSKSHGQTHTDYGETGGCSC